MLTHPSPSAEVKQRLDLYLYFPSVLSWLGIGWTLRFTLFNLPKFIEEFRSGLNFPSDAGVLSDKVVVIYGAIEWAAATGGMVYIFYSILSYQTLSLKTTNLMLSVLFKWIWFIILSLLSVSYDCLHFKQMYCIARGQLELESHVCRDHLWTNNNQYRHYNCMYKSVFGNW